MAYATVVDDHGAEERLVLSDVHIGENPQQGEVISRYRYLIPERIVNRPSHGSCGETHDISYSSSEEEASKSDDDTIVCRRHRKRRRAVDMQHVSRPTYEVLTVVHRMATPLSLVGQQVWSAAFLLADFVLTHEEHFLGAQVVELGAGPGLAGLIAARVARKCYLTDYHDEVLELLVRNVNANRHLFSAEHNALNNALEQVAVRRLDWLDMPTFSDVSSSARELPVPIAANRSKQRCEICSDSTVNILRRDEIKSKADRVEGNNTKAPASKQTMEVGEDRYVPGEPSEYSPPGIKCKKNCALQYEWKQEELDALHSSISPSTGQLILLASDVIYDEDLTVAFFDALRVFFPDYDVLVYESVLYVAMEKRFNFSLDTLSIAATGYRTFLQYVDTREVDLRMKNITQSELCLGQPFVGRKLELNFKQCFNYERSEGMELWEIRRVLPRSKGVGE